MMPASEGGEALKRLLRRHLGLVVGLALLVVCAGLATALATWAVDDPSLSYAVDKVPSNALGLPGAIVADLLMQFFGLASAALIAPAAIWAWRGLFAKPSRFGLLRAASWLGATAAAALALAVLPVTAHWPLPAGLGGVTGDLALRLPALLIGGEPEGLVAGLIAAVAALVSVALLAHAGGFFGRVEIERREPVLADRKAEAAPKVVARRTVASVEEEDEDDEGEDDEAPGRLTLALGWTTHFLYSIATALRRLWAAHERIATRLEPADPLEPMARRAPSEGRIEPRLRPKAAAPMPAAPPAAEDDFDAEDDDFAARAFADDDFAEEPPPAPVAAPRVEPPAPRPKPGKRAIREAQPSLLGRDTFELPPLAMLAEPKATDPRARVNLEALEQNARVLEGVLDDFGVRGEIVNVRPGPVVTLYELEPAPGIKSSRVIGLADDIARSMSAVAARVAVIPGKNAIGIELPNAKREMVYLRELLASEDFEKTKTRLAMCLGKTIGGEPVIADLARMPHLLVAGTTGSGKSVAINTMILSILYRLKPEECRLIMIDPKMLELSVYDGIPHLLTPVVTDPKKAVVALKWTVREMEDRYRKMSKVGVRNIDGFNTRVTQAAERGETITRTIQTGFDKETGEAIYEQEDLDLEPLPYIVVIIDEMADLMIVAGKDIEGAVQRLAQMARAAGIHVVMATQRPSVDVITGTIKANFPTRISFQVTSKIDSRTILGEQGAEQLLGQGDMLYMAGGGRIQRVHGPFVSDDEVEKVVAHLKLQGRPNYLDSVTEDEGEDGEGGGGSGGGGGGSGVDALEESNDLYDKAVAVVLRDRKASTSYIQRRLAIGYNRAASLIERMEKEGLVGPANHAGKREILVGGEEEERF
ncbi:S-DNA-T family DNA segregation ATPase FtsK/SpoIIIE [Prosthecomicrobium pneumaticum]|uniref:DNA translocase FtsK n=2 Tax=Prosthecomicrobium pneumaticum TaxID=81895 RepID=A0A7W9FN36_9HYPH|nr:S-DNA-T family DNA segregation ATPase FtsK/SpoIIIE [Prosthecomicrobium pneumaticum]